MKLTREQILDQRVDALWDEFSRNYPIISSNNFFIRLLGIFFKKTSPKAIWVNGYLKGSIDGIQNEINKQV